MNIGSRSRFETTETKIGSCLPTQLIVFVSIKKVSFANCFKIEDDKVCEKHFVFRILKTERSQFIENPFMELVECFRKIFLTNSARLCEFL